MAKKPSGEVRALDVKLRARFLRKLQPVGKLVRVGKEAFATFRSDVVLERKVRGNWKQVKQAAQAGSTGRQQKKVCPLSMYRSPRYI